MRRSLFYAGCLLWMGGCCTPPPAGPSLDQSQIKTETMAQVVADINANNSRVPTLWAHHFYEANVIDEKKHAQHVSGDGVLLYQTPDKMRLVANAVVGTVFDMGSNEQSFWLKLGPQAGNMMWWGQYSDLAKMNPDTVAIPIRPDMVLNVLGIAAVNTNFSELPAPTMRYNVEQDAYVFLWLGKLPDRWVALREVWYDRSSKRPRLILLYDLNGRAVLRAVLDPRQFRQVEVEGLPRPQWPWIPGDYKLFFPDSGSRLSFTLDEAQLTRKQGPIRIPIPRSFQMPSPEAMDNGRSLQIGRHAGD